MKLIHNPYNDFLKSEAKDKYNIYFIKKFIPNIEDITKVPKDEQLKCLGDFLCSGLPDNHNYRANIEVKNFESEQSLKYLVNENTMSFESFHDVKDKPYQRGRNIFTSKAGGYLQTYQDATGKFVNVYLFSTAKLVKLLRELEPTAPKILALNLEKDGYMRYTESIVVNINDIKDALLYTLISSGNENLYDI